MLRMTRRCLLGLAIAGVAAAPAALAHHGWGSYEAGTVLTLDGIVEVINTDNPHAELRLKVKEKVWLVTLSPPFRMANRGKPITDIKVGDKVIAVGYPNRGNPGEIRAERITHNGVTVELR